MARSTARATWGITQKNTVAWMGEIPRCLAEHRDLILIHDLGNSLRIQVTLGSLLRPGDYRERLRHPERQPS